MKYETKNDMQYEIVVEWYSSKRDIELGNPYRVVDSGFSKDLTLHEAGILKSKMSDAPCCKMLRINKIKLVGKAIHTALMM